MTEVIFKKNDGYGSEYSLREAFEFAACEASDTEDALRGIGAMLAVVVAKMPVEDQLAVLNTAGSWTWYVKEPHSHED